MFKRLFSLKSTKIKVIGVGGGGNNIVNHLADCELEGLSLIACDLDATTLSRSKASVTLQLGSSGLGVTPIIAREAKKKGITTVGVFTLPFQFEGEGKCDKR